MCLSLLRCGSVDINIDEYGSSKDVPGSVARRVALPYPRSPRCGLVPRVIRVMRSEHPPDPSPSRSRDLGLALVQATAWDTDGLMHGARQEMDVALSTYGPLVP